MCAFRGPVKSRLGNPDSVKSRLGYKSRTEQPLTSSENVVSKHTGSINSRKLVKVESIKTKCSNSQDWTVKMDDEERRRRQVRNDVQK